MASEPMAEQSKAYSPAAVEERLYRWWLERGYFTPQPDPSRRSFVVIMPPPNVTGELHLGHALTAALEDTMVRWHRMLGDTTLWLPGTDHAGIATQWVVEQQLRKEGTSRQELGRERFEARVWEWVRTYGSRIDEQHKRLGASCDWTRKRFTLDPGPSKAVRTTFVNMHRDGLIYRGERIINWCPRCATALADLEVEHSEQTGKLYYIRYPFQDGSGYVVVATTRPETMLGDTAVAVNPGDPRHAGEVGRTVVLPLMDRPIPVVADEAVSTEFGTGALKVTPAHDPADFEIGQRHHLPRVLVIGFDGVMTQEAGAFAGLERFEARKRIVARLEELGLLEKVEEHRHAVGTCYRCKTVIEPLPSQQWFVRVGSHTDPASLAGRAYLAVKEGHIRIVPERFVGVYLNWMENIRDWCISRQLWWGHRIPVWYCRDCGHQTVAVTDPAACERCGASHIEQDPDVLDTWFSSGLWTHSTLGWPDDTEDLRAFYPTSVMETGYDILFFWVARMVMMGLYNTGKEPFHTVYLHGLVRDPYGVKMSKTRGNVMDPLDLIQRYGTDALRFALVIGVAPGNDQRLSEAKMESARNFANKVWNASRFVLGAIESSPAPVSGWFEPALLHREDRWIVSRLHRTIAAVGRRLQEFQFGEAQRALYDFFWGEFADWYIEMAKVRLRAGSAPSPLPVLAHVLERTLRLLHPFMPFITEEVWQRLRAALPREGGLPESIVIAPYPTAEERRYDEAAEAELDLLVRTVRAIRNARAELRIEAGRPLAAHVDPADARSMLEEEAAVIRTLARVEPLSIANGVDTPAGEAVTLVVDKVAVLLPLAGIVNVAAERRRLEHEAAETEQALARVRELLAKDDFRARAPEEVVEREEERLRTLEEKQQRLQEFLARLR